MRLGRPLARSVLALAFAATPLLTLSTAAQADAPTAAGWWNFATRDGLPQPPPPPDVGDGDLLVQSGDPSGASTGNPDGTATPSAVAAVRFTIPAGASVGPLSFEVPSGASATDVRAYPTSDPWKPVQNGPLAKAPKPNLSRYSLGVLTGTKLVFADIGRLVPDEGMLSVVILPGATDRVVLRKPGPGALTVTSGGQTTTSSDQPPPPPPVSTSSGSSGAAPVGGFAGSSSALPPALPGVGEPAAPAVAGPAVVAAEPAAPAAAPVSGLPAAARPRAVDDARTRYFAAAEAALVLITFGLLGWGPLARLAALTGAAPATAPADPPPARGVGRFSRPREGAVVRL